MQGATPIVACWGELVWDLFAEESATSTRMNGLGGSAAAVAAQLSALGADARLVSAVGQDEGGERALEVLQRRGVSVSGVLRCQASPTASVRVRVHAGGEPEYSANQRLDWSSVDFEQALRVASEGADALVFSLFAQGTCLDLGALERALLGVGGDRPRLIGCDLNLRREVSAEALTRVRACTDFVKLNQRELGCAAQALPGEEPVDWLLGAGRTSLVVVTSGANGARLSTRAGTVVHSGHTPPALVDTVGAGDAFFAALTLALLAELPHDEALASAIARAESQLTLFGAMPRDPRSSDESR